MYFYGLYGIDTARGNMTATVWKPGRKKIAIELDGNYQQPAEKLEQKTNERHFGSLLNKSNIFTEDFVPKF
jgi:hypothetical protein